MATKNLIPIVTRDGSLYVDPEDVSAVVGVGIGQAAVLIKGAPPIAVPMSTSDVYAALIGKPRPQTDSLKLSGNNGHVGGVS